MGDLPRELDSNSDFDDNDDNDYNDDDYDDDDDDNNDNDLLQGDLPRELMRFSFLASD